MPEPGDVVAVEFPGATGIKRRPAVIVSSQLYHAIRPDVILGVITSPIAEATSSLYCLLQEWRAAGLRLPSAFRSYFATALLSDVRQIGRLSPSDWSEVQRRVALAIALPPVVTR
jgi:mRNA interferase MazF